MRNKHLLIVAFVGTFLSVLFVTERAQAAAGDLDTSFSGDGLFTLNIGTGQDTPDDVALQPDGKLVIAGFSSQSSGDFLVVRLNADGSLDTGFDTDGIQTHDFDGNNDSARAVVVQPDGKIIVAGAALFGSMPFEHRIGLVRFNSDGSLDTSFGTSGVVTTTVPNQAPDVFDMKIQSDGKIVVAGFTKDPTAVVFSTDLFVTRYNPDGTVDTTFSGGFVVTDLGSDQDFGNSLVIQPDGKIILTGSALEAPGFSNMAAVRYGSNGVLDASFATGGIFLSTQALHGNVQAEDVRVQADGKILLAGAQNENATSRQDFALMRLDSNGIIDTTFGTGGLVITAVSDRDEPNEISGEDNINSIELQEDGKIVAAGAAGIDEGFTQDFCIARYNLDGSLDTTFGGGDGVVTTDFQAGNGTDAVRAGIAGIQANGKIIVVGSFWDPPVSERNFAVAKYVGNSADVSVGTGSGAALTSAAALAVGENTSFEIRVHNNGPEEANGADLTYEVPSGLTLVSAVPSQGTCTGTSTVFCDFVSIADGETATVTVTVTPTAAGTIDNTFLSTAQVVDADEGNNELSVALTVTEGGGGCSLVRAH